MARGPDTDNPDTASRRDAAYPIQPRVDRATHLKVRIVILRVPGESKFVASTLEDPKVSVSASTRKGAQEAAMRAYVAKHGAKAKVRNLEWATAEEEARFAPVLRERSAEPSMSAEHWLKKSRRAAK